MYNDELSRCEYCGEDLFTEPLKANKEPVAEVPCSAGLLAAIHRYKDACDAASTCPDMILSSGRTEEAAKLMQEVGDAKEAMFNMAGN